MSALESAVALGRTLGRPELDLAILAEGNTSAREDETSFWVKASGMSLREIDSAGFVRVHSAPIHAALEKKSISDEEVEEVLTVAKRGARLKPSVETFMHAYLLSLPGITLVGHCHPTPVVSLLSLENSAELAKQRLFPDEVVCCGPAAAYVPYTDPGIVLAHAIKDSVEKYVKEHGDLPKTIWLANHGLIAIGSTVQEIESATFMSVKAARAWLYALGTGQKLRPMTRDQIERIHTRPDEHYRQRLLWQVSGKTQ